MISWSFRGYSIVYYPSAVIQLFIILSRAMYVEVTTDYSGGGEHVTVICKLI